MNVLIVTLDQMRGVLPGFDVELDLGEDARPWLAWLTERGYPAAAMNAGQALETEPDRPAEYSITAFSVVRLIGWLKRQTDPWFAHLSLLRPHPPYAAAGRWAKAYDPADVAMPASPATGPPAHPSLEASRSHIGAKAPCDEADIWRTVAPRLVAEEAPGWPCKRGLDRQNLAVLRSDDAAYVQFGDGSWLGFDLAADPSWGTPCPDPVRLHSMAAAMLAWRAEHAERTMTGFILADGGIGRRPPSVGVDGGEGGRGRRLGPVAAEIAHGDHPVPHA